MLLDLSWNQGRDVFEFPPGLSAVGKWIGGGVSLKLHRRRRTPAWALQKSRPTNIINWSLWNALWGAQRFLANWSTNFRELLNFYLDEFRFYVDRLTIFWWIIGNNHKLEIYFEITKYTPYADVRRGVPAAFGVAKSPGGGVRRRRTSLISSQLSSWNQGRIVFISKPRSQLKSRQTCV